ncbi:MAG: nitrilase-related carbon-nitrogen hydrolase, partial [Gammaproteobacteria bacterium]
MTNTLTIALWASNLAAAVADLAAWVQIVEARMVEAKAAGAAILLLPEYASAQWLRFAPADLPEHREIPWLADYAEAALQALAPLPARHGVALLAGTIPAHCPAATPPLRNRAHLLLPDGRTSTQDKLSLTPDERDPAAWNLAPGTRLQIVEWQGLRLAVVICLDIELPALAARLAPFELDLVLVPSMTSGGGFWRVSSCCRARAVELFTVVAMV